MTCGLHLEFGSQRASRLRRGGIAFILPSSYTSGGLVPLSPSSQSTVRNSRRSCELLAIGIVSSNADSNRDARDFDDSEVQLVSMANRLSTTAIRKSTSASLLSREESMSTTNVGGTSSGSPRIRAKYLTVVTLMIGVDSLGMLDWGAARCA